MEEAVKEQIEEVVEELSPEEVEMGKELGVIEEPKEEVKEDLGEIVPEKTEVVEKTEQEIIIDKMEKGEELTPEEDSAMRQEEDVEKRAFYFKYKAEKQKRQTISKQKELSDMKVNASKTRIEELESKIKKLESGEFEEEELTKEQAIAKAKNEILAEEKVSDIDRKNAEYKRSLIDELSLQEMSKNPDYAQIESEFLKIVGQDPKVAKMVMDKLEGYDGSSLAGRDLINFTYAVVEESGFKAQPKVDKNAEEKTKRMIENSTKPKSTASISTGSAPAKTFEELEATDVLNMSDKDWRNLPEDKREVLLKKYG